MFGNSKHHEDTTKRVADPTTVVHQFDQTNGVLKAYDDYLARTQGITPGADAGGKGGNAHPASVPLIQTGAMGRGPVAR